MDFTWAVDYPDVRRTCTLFQLDELTNPTQFKYRPLPAITQEGPQCGPVALAMFARDASKGTVNEIVNEAKNRGYTYNGEMFSAADMCRLARDVLATASEEYEGALNCRYIIEFLLSGGCMLVPYDSDRNHAPCLEGGRKAHWAAVSGLIETEEAVYVLARHGKSRNVAIWTLRDLSDSNSQLAEFSPDRKSSNLEYKLPEGGLAGCRGLRNKAVLIRLN